MAASGQHCFIICTTADAATATHTVPTQNLRDTCTPDKRENPADSNAGQYRQSLRARPPWWCWFLAQCSWETPLQGLFNIRHHSSFPELADQKYPSRAIPVCPFPKEKTLIHKTCVFLIPTVPREGCPWKCQTPPHR